MFKIIPQYSNFPLLHGNAESFIEDLNSVYVLMPFGKEKEKRKILNKIFLTIKTTVENACFRGGKLNCSRADLENSLIISEDIFQKIKKAGLTIFDISYPNLNVYFELGIACALDKKILLTFNPTLYYNLNNNEQIPFDINQFRYLEYRDNRDLENELVKKVEKIIKLEDFTKVDLQKIYKKLQKISRGLEIDTEADQIKEDTEISDYEENIVCDVLDEFWNDKELKKKNYDGVRYDDIVEKVNEKFGRNYYSRLKDILIFIYLSNRYQPLIAHFDRAEFQSFRDEYYRAKKNK